MPWSRGFAAKPGPSGTIEHTSAGNEARTARTDLGAYGSNDPYLAVSAFEFLAYVLFV